MVYPTKSLIIKIDATTLGTQAAGLDGLANSIEHGARTIESTIVNLDWSGGSREAAVDRGTSEKTQPLRVATALDSLREAAATGSTGAP